ncbi:hypothetical protein Mahau_1543 [Mahella australiensis 50-1 BON]|uniref:Uncharacterized protein n=2 Tax=Mahella TaxID=252965 RepID=F3ZYJ0_MAHA5|nr:hypothetical protein Mahau_1543 [Mahella australiensis 50-1 BON]
MRAAIDGDIYRAILPLRRRISLRNFVNYVFLGFVAALVQTVIWVIASFFYPIMELNLYILLGGAAVLAVFMALGMIFKPSLTKVAYEIDDRGLQQRVITSYELSGRNDVFAILQRQDTIKRLNQFDPKSIPLLMVSKRRLYAAAAATALLIALMLIPNPQDRVIRERVRVQEAIDKGLADIDKAEDELAHEVQISDEQKQDIAELLEKLKQDLKKRSDYKEAMKEISKTEDALKEQLEQARANEMQSVAQSLGKSAASKALADAIERRDAEAIESEIEKLKSVLGQGLDKDAAADLQKALADAAAAAKDLQLKGGLQNAADAIASDIAGGTGLSAAALDGLQGQLTQMAQGISGDPADIQYMLQQMKGHIAQAAGQGDTQMASSGSQGSQDSGSQGQGGSDGNAGSDSNNKGSGSGSGGGSGSDSNSSGNGSGGGSGIGGGHTSQDAGYNDSGASGGSVNKPEGDADSYTEHERIYDPTRLGDGGETSHIADKPSDSGGSQQIDAGSGVGSLDGFMPYNEVFGDYQSQAMESMERGAIPPNMREIVRQYFSSLVE